MPRMRDDMGVALEWQQNVSLDHVSADSPGPHVNFPRFENSNLDQLLYARPSRTYLVATWPCRKEVSSRPSSKCSKPTSGKLELNLYCRGLNNY